MTIHIPELLLLCGFFFLVGHLRVDCVIMLADWLESDQVFGSTTLVMQ